MRLHYAGARALALGLQLFATTRVVAQTPAAIEGYVVTSDSARLYYRIAGHGPDTLIAIHGGPGVDLESIAADFAPLNRRHTVIFYDQRGAGRSELRRATLIAHSYGPLLAASYAIVHPDAVDRMIFLGPVPPRRGAFWERFAANMSTRLDSAEAAGMAGAIQRLSGPDAGVRAACGDLWGIGLKTRLAEPARTQPLIQSDLCGSAPAGIRYGLLTTNRVVMASYGDWDLRERLRAITIPVLIIHGSEDAIPMDLVEEWETALVRAELIRVPRAAHFPYVEQPDTVWPTVKRFLRRTAR